MKSISFRRIARGIAPWFIALAAAVSITAQAQPTAQIQTFDIPPQELSSALIQFSDQTGIQVVTSGYDVVDRMTAGVSGTHSVGEALDILLDGTGLNYQSVSEDTISLTLAQNTAAGQNTIGQRRPGIEEIIVTGQKREERIQDVPIAISAFSPEDLEAQKIEGGFDLLKGVPNVTFSKTNFTGYNFQIRGIGTQAVSATTDPGVAISLNNTTLIVNRLFEQEYLDVERVEVLRGPQGTLFGRNATGGVVNVITNKPELGVWDGMLDVEVGNYAARRLRGFFNAPIGDEIAIRGAYASTKRDGFGYNEYSEVKDNPFRDPVKSDVDNRDLWTGRLSLGWQPNDRFRLDFIWERFEEEDRRVRTSKQLCHRDDENHGLISNHASFGLGEPVDVSQYIYGPLSQGCQAGSLYSDDAYGTPNGASLPYNSAAFWGPYLGQGLGTFAGAQQALALGGNPYYTGGLSGIVPGTGPLAGQNACGDDNLATSNVVAFVPGMLPTDACNPDIYGGRTQSRDLRTINSRLEPTYRATSDIFELSWDLELTDSLVFTSQTVWVEDEYYASQDYNRFASDPLWNNSSEACGFNFITFGNLFLNQGMNCSDDPNFGVGTFAALTDSDGDGIVDQTDYPLNQDPLRQEQGTYTVGGGGFVRDEDGRRVGFYRDLSPDGVLCDPQLGCSDTLLVQDISSSESTQFNQEIRLVSSYGGDWNFSAGANFTRFETTNDYFVLSNGFTHLLNFFPFNYYSHHPVEGAARCTKRDIFCRYVDPNPIEDINGEGHNYFRSSNPYELTSQAIFGELYWQATDTVKITAGLRMTWDQKVFTPIPSQLLLGDYREIELINPGDGPEACIDPETGAQASVATCPLAGNAVGGRGSPADPDIEQSWREPTGRLVVDWSPMLPFTDETMVYASFAHGYKGGGANPPSVAPPSKFLFDAASGGAADTFEAEYVNAYEIGTKNTLFNGALTLNGTAFYYDYTDYQVSRIFDRRAVNDNFDAEVWGLEFESIFAPTLNWQFNAAIGYLQTEIGKGEQSIDLIDRTAGGNRHFAADPDAVGRGSGATTDFPHGFDEWIVLQPWVTSASNCVVPKELVEGMLLHESGYLLHSFCPTGNLAGASTATNLGTLYFQRDANGEYVRDANGDRILVNGSIAGGGGDPDDFKRYDPSIDAPNGGAGFFKDLGGNELPNAPNWTVSLGGQYNFDLTRNWRATARVDYYWQGQSWARVYNSEYDRLKSWSNTNLSFWINNPNSGITVEAYVKNVFDETPITGSFLNSDDSGLTTNVFTLDPRLIGVSLRKEF